MKKTQENLIIKQRNSNRKEITTRKPDKKY